MIRRGRFLSLLFVAFLWLSSSCDANVFQQARTGLAKLDTTIQTKLFGLPPPVIVKGGTASIPNEVFNLAKAIVGVAALSLPAGLAAFGSAPSALIPGLLLIVSFGTLSANGFAVIGKVCSFTGATSYREAWKLSVSDQTSWMPALAATAKTFLACLACSMVLGDTFQSLLQLDRTKTLVSLTAVVLLPLCWMKSLKSLAPFSLLGVLGMVYTSLALLWRYCDGSYVAEGKLWEQITIKPEFGDLGWRSVFSPNSLILVCMLSTAFMAHFSAPKFFVELKDNTIARYNTVVALGYGIAILISATVAAFGYLTFGTASSGVILSNYANTDTLMAASRIAVSLSLIFSYPILFQGCRDGVLDIFQIQKRDDKTLNVTTIAILCIVTFLAATLQDVSFVLAFGGATLGNALTYLFPAIMYSSIVEKQGRKDERFGVFVSNLSAVLGVVIGVVGAKMAIDK